MELGIAIEHLYKLDSDDDLQCLSASGVRIGSNFILCPASVLFPFSDYLDDNYFMRILRKKKFLTANEFYVSGIPHRFKSSFLVYVSDKNIDFIGRHINEQPNKETYNGSFNVHKAQLLIVWTCFEIYNKLFNCSLDEMSDSVESLGEELILSSFCILYFEDFDFTSRDILGSLNGAIISLLELSSFPRKGSYVLLEATPFSASFRPNFFFNSWSLGIVSNVYEELFFLTDVRCISGCEGAPVYFYENGLYLGGLMLRPFVRKNSEWKGLSLVVSAKVPLNSLRRLTVRKAALENNESLSECTQCKNEIPAISFSNLENNNFCENSTSLASNNFMTRYLRFSDKLLKKLEASVVAIKIGEDWGTGFVINHMPCVILSCAHVVKGSVKDVSIITVGGVIVKGRLLFKTDYSDDSLWDIALVSTDAIIQKCLPVASVSPCKGWPIICAGYGALSPDINSSTSFSCGIVSSVTSIPSSILYGKGETTVPIEFQTTCTIYGGASGGPIVANILNHGPAVIGMICSNIVNHETKAVHPRFNVALPLCSVYETISLYLKSKDISVLSKLNVRRSSISVPLLEGKAKL